MTPVDFLARVLPPQDGKLWFSAIVQSKKGDEKFMWGRAFRTHEELIDFAVRQAQRKDELYFTCAAQHTAVEAKSAGGNPYMKPQRVAHNCVGFKSLWMDIDLKGAGTWEEQATTAILSVVEMCSKNALPKPTILVRSGNGLHVYWTFNAAVETTVWKQMAESLKQVALNHGLVGFDPVCTADAARILRVPGTFNWKDPAQGKPVQVVKASPQDIDAAAMAEALAPFFVMPAPSAPVLQPGFGDLAGGLTIEARPVEFAAVLPNCEVLREAVATGGKDFEEPLWYQTLRAASYAENGEMWAHAMSKGHPSYSEAETAKKFDYAVDQKTTGWPKCATFSQHRPSMCARCPKFAQGKSPLNHRVIVVAGKPVSNDELPEPYTRNEQGLIVVPILNKGDENDSYSTVPVWDYAAHTASLKEIQGKLYLTFKAEPPKTQPGARTHVVQVPVEVMNEPRDVNKALGKCHVMVDVAFKERLGRFLMSWTKKLQAESDVINRHAFGWCESGGKIEGFSYGGYCHSKAGEQLPTAEPERNLKSGYSPCGSLDVWKAAAKSLTDQRRPAADTMLASAFASPLAHMTGLPGLVFALCSGASGTGKTTAMKIALSVWGHPTQQLTSMNDTTASVANKMGVIRNLPLYWDELRDPEETKRFAQLVFQVTQGKERARLSSNLEQRHVGTWATMLVCAANASVLERVAQACQEGPAGFYRVLEVEMPQLPGNDQSFVGMSDRIADLNDNYGHAGLLYAEYLGQNSEAVKKFVQETAENVRKLTAAAPPERFWVFTAACLIAGATLSNQLGLTEIDVAAMQDHLCGVVIPHLRDVLASGEMGVTASSNGDEDVRLLRDFVNECQAKGTFLMTDKAAKRGQKDPTHIITVLAPANPQQLRQIDCHRIKEAEKLLIRRTALSTFLHGRAGSAYGKIKDFEVKLGAKYTSVKMGAQTLHESAAAAPTLQFDTSNDVRLREMFE